jgi:hypothetical protein
MTADSLSMSSIDFYDHAKLEKLHEKRSMKWLKFYLKAKQGDPKAIEAING